MLSCKDKQIFQSLMKDYETKIKIFSGLKYDILPYRKVVEMAKNNKEYIPLIFEGLNREFRWSQALMEILEDYPLIKSEDAGRVSVIINAWIEFGKEKGFVK